jgi:aryl-alcohol dehydrogenase-like predicted oxidoreductase
MQHRTLGATGIRVSEFALGTMMFGQMGNPDHDDAIRIIHSALDAGIDFIDTADVYSMGESEEIVGKALRGRRDQVVLATKFGLPMSGDPRRSGASRRWIVQAVEDSLRRLGTDHIDLYQLHRPDYDTAIEETLSALSDLVTAGKIRAFGSSTFPADRIVEAQWAAERRGTHRFLSEQPMYSIFDRSLEAAVLPAAQRHGMGVLTYSPLNGGWLSGHADVASRHRAGSRPAMYDPSSRGGAAKTAALAELRSVADDAGLTLPQLALGFVLAHPAITSVIIGPRTQEQLDGLLTADGVRLDAATLDRIDAIVPPGTDLDPDDNYNAAPPALRDAALRRRCA